MAGSQVLQEALAVEGVYTTNAIQGRYKRYLYDKTQFLLGMVWAVEWAKVP